MLATCSQSTLFTPIITQKSFFSVRNKRFLSQLNKIGVHSVPSSWEPERFHGLVEIKLRLELLLCSEQETRWINWKKGIDLLASARGFYYYFEPYLRSFRDEICIVEYFYSWEGSTAAIGLDIFIIIVIL